MYLLIFLLNACLAISLRPLHSTMYLLILDVFESEIVRITLHSTMYLLILAGKGEQVTTKFTLHSTMYLLISHTQHYISAKSIPLHSTMYLLIYLHLKNLEGLFVLYIPLCIY